MVVIRNGHSNPIYDGVSALIPEEWTMFSGDPDTYMTIMKNGGPPRVQVYPRESKIFVYDPEFMDFATNIKSSIQKVCGLELIVEKRF